MRIIFTTENRVEGDSSAVSKMLGLLYLEFNVLQPRNEKDQSKLSIFRGSKLLMNFFLNKSLSTLYSYR